jgi:4-amino-4-deoxy-L-arabinose transferase-like glycosyltransferase
MKKEKKYLVLIIALAFVLRFWRLGVYPALNADEAAIGYNAYSIIETGRDEHGNAWPIHFQSFNDYKPGLYFYLVLPFVKLFGLNALSVRVPGAILGVATVYLLYLLVKQLRLKRYGIEILAPFLLAINPWHIHFSRGGWEVNVATFLMVLGTYLFLRGIKRRRFLLWSSLVFVLSLYTYHSARVVVPLLVLGLFVIYRKRLRENLKQVFVAVAAGVILLVPLVVDFTKGAGISRAAGVGLFADPGPIERINQQRAHHEDFTSLVSQVMHNKAVNYSLAFFENWSQHYHGEYLFLSGDEIQRNKVPETGQMYLFDILFLTAGFVAIVKGFSKHRKAYSYIIWWLLVAPTAAALTFQSPHALRSQNMVIPMVIVSSVGLSAIMGWLSEKKHMILFAGKWLLALFIAWCFIRYQLMYWKHMAKEYPFSSQYGVKQLANYVSDNYDKYQKFVVSDRYDQPYILFLFYLKYPPEKFQDGHALTAPDRYGFSTVATFDKFEFKDIDWDVDKLQYPNSLIVGTDEDIPDEVNIVEEIYGINGYKYFQIVAN